MRRFSAPSQMSPHGWCDHAAGELAVGRSSSTLERAKSMPSRSRTRSVKKVKPPDTSSTFRPAALQAAHQLLGAGVELQPLVVDLLQRRHRHALQQRHAPAQAFLEVGDLAAHRGLGDGGDLGLLPTASAISSMHSMLISVESMSKAISLKSVSAQGRREALDHEAGRDFIGWVMR